jgi:hypothetical protein
MFKDIEIPKRLSGHVEQVICAAGRTFVGTTHSTFSSYIVRLRGYMNSPDQRRFIHSTKGAVPTPTRFDQYTELPWLWDDEQVHVLFVGHIIEAHMHRWYISPRWCFWCFLQSLRSAVAVVAGCMAHG